MRHVVALSLAGVLLLATSACDQWRNAGNASAGAPPPVPSAVGPVPGPGGVRNVATNPYSGNAIAVSEGRRLFTQMNCSGCHGGRGGGGMGPTLRDVDWRYGSRDDQIFDSIAQGRAKGMPAWGTRLPSDQIWKIVAYIKTMRTDQEPDKPQDFP